MKVEQAIKAIERAAALAQSGLAHEVPVARAYILGAINALEMSDGSHEYAIAILEHLDTWLGHQGPDPITALALQGVIPFVLVEGTYTKAVTS